MSIQNNKNWLLRSLPPATWIPSQWDTVNLVKSRKSRPALILTKPVEPKDVKDVSKLKQRPYICDVLLGEDIIKDVDISEMKPLK